MEPGGLLSESLAMRQLCDRTCGGVTTERHSFLRCREFLQRQSTKFGPNWGFSGYYMQNVTQSNKQQA